MKNATKAKQIEELIYKANHYNGFIVCPGGEANKISSMAATKKCDIHFPLTYNELLTVKRDVIIHISEVDKFIQFILNQLNPTGKITVETVEFKNDTISDEAEKKKEPKKPELPQEKQKDGSPAEMTDEA